MVFDYQYTTPNVDDQNTTPQATSIAEALAGDRLCFLTFPIKPTLTALHYRVQHLVPLEQTAVAYLGPDKGLREFRW